MLLWCSWSVSWHRSKTQVHRPIGSSAAPDRCIKRHGTKVVEDGFMSPLWLAQGVGGERGFPLDF
jgi:hypothetical protein